MLTEVVKEIERLSTAATGATVAPIEARNATFVDLHNGSTPVKVDADFPARVHDFATVEALCDFLNDGPEVEGGEQSKAWPAATVWHNGNDVIAVLVDVNDGHRDDRAQLLLNPSEIFKAAMEDGKSWRDQRQFVKWIVKSLRDQFESAAPGLLEKLRNLSWNSSNAATGTVTKSRESMSQDVLAALNEAETLPDVLVLRVPRWAALDCVVDVKLFLEVDLEQRKFRLEPLADEAVLAESKAHEWLANRLNSETQLPVYYGTP